MPDTAHRRPQPLRAALIYDFDGTLARGNLQERSFIPDIAGMKHADFWMEVKLSLIHISEPTRPY